MSTSEIAPDRLEALLRGEAGIDERERRMGALLDELNVGETPAPAELRERVRSLATTASPALPAARRLPRMPRGRRRLVPAAGVLAAAAVIVAVAITQTRGPSSPVRAGFTGAIGPTTTGQERALTSDPNQKAVQLPATHTYAAAGRSTPSGPAPIAAPALTSAASVPAPDGQRAQDYAASLRLSVGSVAELSRSTQSVLDTVHALGGAVESVDYGTPSAGSGSALIELRIPVARSQDALRSFSALGTITSQQVQIRDLQSGLDQETNRARALRHRIALQRAKLLSPTLTPEARATLESNLADSQTALESVLRGVHATQQRAAFARFSLDLVTGSGLAVVPQPRTGAFDRTAHDALDVISVAGRGALFAAIVGGPFLLLAAGGWWTARRLRRRAARRLLESS
jgi:Domain of unknown function (DUF4349)